ncbi:MAG: hypothetical protein LUF84_00120 [Clostridiales bacterium]|nr:hypothetical protein [Clostridiales bacterium]
MGGRGASTGVSDKGKPYGSEYTTVLKSGNIKFVRYNDSTSAKTPMETMTKGRIYVTVNEQNELKAITFYDKNNKRYKQIDLSGPAHMIDGKPVLPHTHFGDDHDEHGTAKPSEQEQKIIDKVNKIWYNRHNKQ